MELDLSPFRGHFPSLRQKYQGKRLVFFDNPGGTQVPQSVIDHTTSYFQDSVANVHGGFLTSQRTDAVIEECHVGLAALLGGAPDEIVLGANMTTLTFALSRSLAREWQPGDEIVVTTLDHDANITPWRMAAEERGVTVRQVDINPADCTLDWADLTSKITPRTKLVAVGWSSNAVGTITDVRQVVALAHSVGALCFVDAVQAVPHIPCDVAALGADFVACSAYKFFGPHIGVLWGRREHLERLTVYKVRPAPETLPSRWETGTQNHEGQAAINGALEYLGGLGVSYIDRYEQQLGSASGQRLTLLAALHVIEEYERDLGQYLIAALQSIPGERIYGITAPERAAERVPTVAFCREGLAPQAIAARLAAHGIAVWSGHYYALALVERLGLAQTGGMVRVGLAHYNTRDEIDQMLNLVEAMRQGD
ncbi:MAG: cysteine desulfurase-like protein [Herpetosiphonaceae bacterium]|nr:cysteine desulfurase-like protein [Herpetosiphonaceae bacterium]